MSSIFFYKLEYGGNWVVGVSKSNIRVSNFFVKEVRFQGGEWKVGVVNPTDGSYLITMRSVGDYKKENGQPYLSFEEFNRLTEDFFSETSIRNKLKYSCFLFQEGANNPTAVVLEDTIGDLVWTRLSAGTYSLTKTNGFPSFKTVPYRDNYSDNDGNLIKLETISNSELRVMTYDKDNIDTLSDGILQNQYFNIEVYI